MKNNYLYRKVFGLLIVALFAVSCSSNGVAGGPTDGPVGNDNLPLRKGCFSSKALFSQIDRGSIPENLSGYDQDSQEVFSNYPAKAKVTARYVKENGTGDGSSASKASGNVKTVLDGITNASANNIYMVLIEPGVYAAKAEMSMKNHVAIIGKCSGDIEEEGDEVIVLSGGRKHGVFNNMNIDRTATLHGVTITGGKASYGGGMLNENSSPLLNRVTFAQNEAGFAGGGLFNHASSPLLTEVTFFKNVVVGETVSNGGPGAPLWDEFFSSVGSGGGMADGNAASAYKDERKGSFPVLIGVTFFGNSAYFGGAVYIDGGINITNGIFSQNRACSGGGIYASQNTHVNLNGVIYSGNVSSGDGGALYNNLGYLVMTGGAFFNNEAEFGAGLYHKGASTRLDSVTFTGNKASKEAGGIYVTDIDGRYTSPVVVNSILWGNSPAETGGREAIFGASIVRDVTNSVNPGLLPFNYYTRGEMVGGVAPTSISAVNQGLYVRKAVGPEQTIYYYSADNTTWYRDPELRVADTPPADTIDITATDITGAPRIGRPDIGAFEAR